MATTIPLIRISEDEQEHYLERGGLHGSELDGISAPIEEYDQCVALLVEALTPFGTRGIGDEHAYYVDLYARPDYFPCVEIAHAEVLSLSLIGAVAETVRKMPQKYRVDLCNAFCFWNDPINVIVEHDRIYWYAANDVTARRAGILAVTEIECRP
jgi:hypothetical protein